MGFRARPAALAQSGKQAAGLQEPSHISAHNVCGHKKNRVYRAFGGRGASGKLSSGGILKLRLFTGLTR